MFLTSSQLAVETVLYSCKMSQTSTNLVFKTELGVATHMLLDGRSQVGSTTSLFVSVYVRVKAVSQKMSSHQIMRFSIKYYKNNSKFRFRSEFRIEYGIRNFSDFRFDFDFDFRFRIKFRFSPFFRSPNLRNNFSLQLRSLQEFRRILSLRRDQYFLTI